MNKFLLISIFFITNIVSAPAQYNRNDTNILLGINASYLYPTGNMGKILKNGIGSNLSFKYLLNKIIGIGIESGFYRFKSKIAENQNLISQNYLAHLMPFLLEATFYIPTWNQITLPYAGILFGGYLTQIKIQQENTSNWSLNNISKNLFLFSPGIGLHAGILYQLASEKWWLDFRIRLDYVPKIQDEYKLNEYNYGNIGFDKMLNIGSNIGILYKF